MVSDALIDLVSGSAGGVANVLVGQPMDTVKVRFAMSCCVIRYHVVLCVVQCDIVANLSVNTWTQ